MKDALSVIRTALHVHGVRTADEYRRAQQRYIAARNIARPWLAPVVPFVSTDTPAIYVGSGKWLVRCTNCGNAPAVSPQDGLACCFECGAVYQGLEMPAASESIEALLVARPNRHDRAWDPSEPLEQLLAENIELGVTVEEP